LIQFDLDLRIDVAEPVVGRFQFAAANVLCSMKYLPLKIRKIDVVEIDNADCPDAGGREIKRSRRSESAGADAQNARCL